MSVQATRTVRRLRLRGPGEGEVRRTAHRVEDALRVASLRDPAGRLVVVRQVALPPLEAGSSSQSIALELERAVQRALALSVHGTDAGAAAASVVWFADRLEAHVAAALRTLSGRRLDAWFWPLAIPSLAGPGPPLRALILSLAELKTAPVAIPAWVVAVARAGGSSGLARLSAELDHVDVSVVARAAGIGRGEGRPTRVSGHDGTRGPQNAPPPGHTPLPGHAPMGQSPTPRTLIARLCAKGGAGGVAVGSGRAEVFTAALAEFSVDAEERARFPQPDSRAAPGRPEQPTEAAGLLFLLPVLAQLGFGEWSERHPDWGRWLLAGRVLTIWADRLDVPADDPVRRALPSPVHEVGQAPSTWEAPEPFRALTRGGGEIRRGLLGLRAHWDGSSALLLAFSPGQGSLAAPAPAPAPAPAAAAGAGHGARAEAVARADAVAGAWAVAARRWLRRRTGIGVPHLVRRVGRLALSPTHVDVTLPLSGVDLKIRRAGLDLDPGWLPWFRRVVRFHYDAGSGNEAGRRRMP